MNASSPPTAAGSASRPSRAPVYVARAGNITLPVRQYQNRGRPIYTFESKSAAGQRVPTSRRNLNAIKTLADKHATELATSGFQSQAQDIDKREELARQFEELQALTKPLQLSPLEVVKAYLRLTEDLKGVPLAQVVQMFIRAGGVQVLSATVPAVVDAFMARDSLAKKGPDYVKQIKSTLTAFAGQFPGPIDQLALVDIETWLFGLEVAETTRRTYHGRLCQLFSFAQARRHLTRSVPHEMTYVPMPSPKRKKAVIIGPEEMAEALALAQEFAPDPDTLLHLVIAGFAGLREVELQTLCWEDILGDENSSDTPQIVLHEDQVKTNTSARSVEVLPTLRAFLKPFRLAGLTGPVFSVCDIKHKASNRLPRWSALKIGLADTQAMPPAKFVWKRNFLRRGFGSYRLSTLKNVDLVTHEMGNTDFVLLTYYTTPVFEPIADRYWAIRPGEGYHERVRTWLSSSRWRRQRARRVKIVAEARAARMQSV
ncbi:MAG: hypothetical protein FD161_1809 [Limisphaerales bacterium]|nr:MAG: hypothetical protein FD161_1809 [Limisphaerales bacterium]TXT47779.1 MAG: hypothetical protein FD140_4052 [Limisphaerales bacterium]